MSGRLTLQPICKTTLRDDARWSPEDPIFIRFQVPLAGAATASLTRPHKMLPQQQNVCNSSCVMTIDSLVTLLLRGRSARSDHRCSQPGIKSKASSRGCTRSNAVIFVERLRRPSQHLLASCSCRKTRASGGTEEWKRWTLSIRKPGTTSPTRSRKL